MMLVEDDDIFNESSSDFGTTKKPRKENHKHLNEASERRKIYRWTIEENKAYVKGLKEF